MRMWKGVLLPSPSIDVFLISPRQRGRYPSAVAAIALSSINGQVDFEARNTRVNTQGFRSLIDLITRDLLYQFLSPLLERILP